MTENLIYIKPKFIESAIGLNKVKYVNGRKEGTTKASGATFTYRIRDNAITKRLNTGLDEWVDNPYYIAEGDTRTPDDLFLPQQWRDSNVWKRPKISKQMLFEIKHNRQPGFYSSETFNWTDKENLKQKRSYLQKLKLILEDKTNILDLNIPDNELLYEAMQKDPFFANSYDEAESSPHARFYVSYQNTNEETLTSDYKLHRKAVVSANELIEKHTKAVHDFIVLLDLSKTELSSDAAENRLYEWVNSKEKIAGLTRKSRIERFNNYYDLFNEKSNNSKTLFKTEVLLQRLINKNVIANNREVYIWLEKRGTSLETLGRSKKEVIDFLSNPANGQYVDELTKELKTR